ncbi:Clp protease N-terminal domain-containing protein [Kitasatospora sp. NPDC059673]|uniref:Clp protease N-terminal domain-containing protein n=1 Tax=Kitasatospora sp. NPDC059673 TaxID=3346901 RepID=UPI0036B893D5
MPGPGAGRGGTRGTDSAKRVLSLRAAAGQRVRRIETGHLLPGLIREGGAAARVLRERGVDLADPERAAEALTDGRAAAS